MKQPKPNAKSIRMTDEVFQYISNFEGDGFNEKLQNIVLFSMKTEAERRGRLALLDDMIAVRSNTLYNKLRVMDANAIYAALDYTFKDLGYHNLFMGTVEAYPSMDSLLRLVGSLKPSRVHLAPFMIVAGDHAHNDLAGDDADSWKSQFEQAGYPVLCHLKGLGEYEGIRQIFLRHIREAQ